MRGTVGVAVAALLGVAVAGGCAAPMAGITPAAHVAGSTAAPAPGPWSPAGALFDGTPDEPGAHYCSASVIDTPAGDVVMTAAHCVADGNGTPPRTGMLFAPGYADGVTPYGMWTVTGAVVDPRWESGGDPDVDVAFLTVEQQGSPPVEDLTGGFRLVVDPGSVNQVDAIGYPDTSDAPVVRSGTTVRFSATQLELDAPGLYDGTSGGPWVRNGHEVIGVTGGYEQGGLVPTVSYASYLDASTSALLARLTG
jgi:V8-like Glu-specific endopeptidase